MVKQTILIYSRIRPSKKSKTGLYDIEEDDTGQIKLNVVVPRELAAGFINNKKENYNFRFDKVFDQKTTQDEIFAHVAQPVIDNVVQGYNGTIFAYGQTGSGKTFTITGGAERYIDRGIIPRSLSYIFETIEKNPDQVFSVHISYLEIYNENGYDLLDPKHEATKLEDLPKVALMEDSDQNIHLKNLTVQTATSEEEALNLLFMGDTNRMIAETPMNQASSRSHCIFTVHLTSKKAGSATIRRAKLHLVDLAGSERVSKTGVNGVLLTEAKYINLSLHFLEQVIIALSEKNRTHVPYRNSMMTSVLRDSLGGNCMTTMIATCSLEKRNVDESISTCRFAQRVAMIKNDVMLNEELDPKLLIAKLKKENAELRQQLELVSGEQLADELTQEDIDRCEQVVSEYLKDPNPESVLDVGHDLRKIQKCFRILKRLVLEKPSPSSISNTNVERHETPPPVDVGPYRDIETQKLKEIVEQRDNEINILVNMLKKERKKGKENGFTRAPEQHSSHRKDRSMENVNGHFSNSASRNDSASTQDRPDSESKIERQKTHDIRRSSTITIDKEDRMKTKILGKMSMGRQEAFDIFMRDYSERGQIDVNKQMLKERYSEAKVMGERLNKSKQKLRMPRRTPVGAAQEAQIKKKQLFDQLKSSLTQYRLHYQMEDQGENNDESEMEREIKFQMEEEKGIYKDTFTTLRSMKSEIEHVQHLLENSKVKLMKDFELWWAEQSHNAQSQHPAGMGPPSTQVSAWNTPPVTPPNTIPQCPPSQRSLIRDRFMGGSDPNIRGSNSSRLGRPSSRESSAGFTLTGDSKVDADIEAFVKARQNILQKVQGPR